MKYVGLLIDIKQDSYGKLVDILLPKDNGHIKSQLTIPLAAQSSKIWWKFACLEASLGSGSREMKAAESRTAPTQRMLKCVNPPTCKRGSLPTNLANPMRAGQLCHTEPKLAETHRRHDPDQTKLFMGLLRNLCITRFPYGIKGCSKHPHLSLQCSKASIFF